MAGGTPICLIYAAFTCKPELKLMAVLIFWVLGLYAQPYATGYEVFSAGGHVRRGATGLGCAGLAEYPNIFIP